MARRSWEATPNICGAGIGRWLMGEEEGARLHHHPNNDNHTTQPQEKLASLGRNKDSFISPLLVCKSGKWRMDLVNGTLSDANSYEISSFQRCHRPLTMFHPANCGRAPASGSDYRRWGGLGEKASQLLFGGGASISS